MSKKDAVLQAGLERLRSEMDFKKNLAATKKPSPDQELSNNNSNTKVSDDGDTHSEKGASHQNITSNRVSNRKSIRESKPKGTSVSDISDSKGLLDFLMPSLGIRAPKDNYSFYIKVSNKERLDLLAAWYGWNKSSPLIDGILSNLFDSLGEEFWVRVEKELKEQKIGKEEP